MQHGTTVAALPRAMTPTHLSLVSDPVAVTQGMVGVLRLADTFAPAATPIVLYGESGTGKTFVAEYIHRLSGREGGFHALSVGTLGPQLAEDELFGHLKGAFTGAREVRTGRIATAGKGTLLLDDVHTLDLGVQRQLLQVLDGGTYSPVGSDRVCVAVCRFILAMTEDPDGLMRRGLLLEDLRYRFLECGIRLPSLAERRAEIPLLAQGFLDRCPVLTQVPGPRRISPGAMERLTEGAYPGNLRQLQGVVVYAYLMAAHDHSAEVRIGDLPEHLQPALRYERRGDPEANRRAIAGALQRTGGNARAAARLLGISPTTINGVWTAGRRREERDRMGRQGGV